MGCNTNLKFLREVKKIITSNESTNINYVSVYLIAELLKEYNNRYNILREDYANEFEYMLKEQIPKTRVIVYNFNYEINELSIGIYNCLKDEFDKISFAKDNECLVITKSDFDEYQFVFNILYSKLLKLYNELLIFSDYEKTNRFGIRTIDYDFLVDISLKEINITNNDKCFNIYSSNDSNEYKCNCYNKNNCSLCELNNRQDVIFKHLFVKINDCPEWSQGLLFEQRKKELEKSEVEVGRFNAINNNIQKKLNFVKKLFPFVKKY